MVLLCHKQVKINERAYTYCTYERNHLGECEPPEQRQPIVIHECVTVLPTCDSVNPETGTKCAFPKIHVGHYRHGNRLEAWD